jgi:hypothetical protein
VSGGPPVPRIERERERERKRLLLSFACVRGQLRESNGAQPAIMSAQQGILVEQQCCGDRREKAREREAMRYHATLFRCEWERCSWEARSFLATSRVERKGRG